MQYDGFSASPRANGTAPLIDEVEVVALDGLGGGDFDWRELEAAHRSAPFLRERRAPKEGRERAPIPMLTFIFLGTARGTFPG